MPKRGLEKMSNKTSSIRGAYEMRIYTSQTQTIQAFPHGVVLGLLFFLAPKVFRCAPAKSVRPYACRAANNST